jgi:SAM-dependent methyltransferase
MHDEHLVEAGYDRMAERYLASKQADDPVPLAALEELARDLPAGGAALDLGCGAGVPATRWLAAHFATTGVDVSARQIALARRHVPAATFVQAGMTEVAFPAASFDAVVALHSIIHVPRAEHAPLVRRIYTWLRPGGAFLATWAMSAWEGAEEDWQGWGAPMWWSHFGAAENLALVREAGFHVQAAEPRTSGDETWYWILARK